MSARARIAFALCALLSACGAPEERATSEPPPPASATANETAGGTSDEPATATPELELVVGDDACETDADCVPSSCCHPSACVAAGSAPTCGDVMCTMDCRPGTMDCGGGCLCQAGRCAARVMPRGDFAVQ